MDIKYLCHQFECLVITQSTFKMKVLLKADTEFTYILKQNLHKGILKTHTVWLMHFNTSILPMSICITTFENSSKMRMFFLVQPGSSRFCLIIFISKIYHARQGAQRTSFIMSTKIRGVWAKMQKLVERWIST